jgi:RNA recognition motif-containing protein
MATNTLYLNGLNEKVKLVELKRALKMVFAQFGKVSKIRAVRNLGLRGQAWITFESPDSAAQALATRQGFNFLEKPLKIDYAKTESDVISRKRGTFQPRVKKIRVEAVVERKRKLEEGALSTEEGVDGAADSDEGTVVDEDAGDGEQAPKKPRAMPPKLVVNSIPHKILFTQVLPDYCTDEIMTSIFGSLPGFVEVRLIMSKKVAFVEFEDTHKATHALEQVKKHKFEQGDPLYVTYSNQ